MHFLILIPALIHVYIFVLESFLWGKPRTNSVFNIRPADVEATRGFAFNQGVYNLLLAVAILLGWGLWLGGPTLGPIFDQSAFAGQVLMAYGLASITVAGLTLLASAPRLWRSALIQIIPAAVGLAALVMSS